MIDLFAPRRTALLKRGFALCLGLGCLWLLWSESRTLDWPTVQRTFTQIGPNRWFLAICFTAGSFWALAQYDVVAHRHFRTGARTRVAQRAGASAIALAQVTGFGPAVSAAVRWRLMPTLGHGRVLQLTAFVTLTFFSAWGILAVGFALPQVSGHGVASVLVLPCLVLGCAALLMRYPSITVLGHAIRLPSLPAGAKLLWLAACDMILAALALHVLMPPDAAVPILQLASAYMLALGAGLIGGTPGGVGPFELALAGLMPVVEPEALAATLLAYRLCYYIVPFVVAAIALATAQPDRRGTADDLPAPTRGQRAELAIAAQADSLGLSARGSQACILRSPHTLTLFLGPTHGSLSPLLAPLRDLAQAQNRVACLYKITRRDAVLLRRTGWAVAPIAQEAVVDPRDFSLEGSEYRQLRRSIRKAQKSGMEFRRLTRPDWHAMQRVNDAWAAAHGGERGLTMGRFCRDFLKDKPIFAAFLDNRLVAFITAVGTPDVLSLDIMRHLPEVPSGAMHGLVAAMIEFARTTGRSEVNLAAVPHARLARYAPGSEGLARFKTSFAPVWRPLYLAAPNRLELALAGLDLWHSIRFPAPLAAASAVSVHAGWEKETIAEEDALFNEAEEVNPAERKAG